jgi:phosphoenolpyruvate carboxylase
MARKTKSERFNDYVVSKFEIYNSLFLTLPFDSIPQTSLLLPLFKDFCSKGYDANLSPKKIVDLFLRVLLVEWMPKINTLYCLVF